jgi:hypothetical protein
VVLISESHGDLNRCILCRGKPDQHATRFPRSIQIWSRTIHFPRSTWATFRQSPWGRNRSLHPEEVLATKDRLAQSSSWVASFFLPCDIPRVGERSFGPVVTQLQQHVIGIFNTCSWGPTHRSLTDIGGGYSLEGVSFPQATPWPSQPTVFTFHLRAPPGLQFSQDLPKVPKFKFREPMAAMWSFDHSTIYRDLQPCLSIANDLPLAIGSTRVDWKVSLV